MKKWVCAVLTSLCLTTIPMYGNGASLEEIAKPLHKTEMENWQVAIEHSLISMIYTKDIDYNKAQNRLSFWEKDVYKEEKNEKYSGNVYRMVADLNKMDAGFIYSDSWSTKKNKVSYVSDKSDKEPKLNPILPGSYMESYVNKALEIAKLPEIPTPHTYEYIGLGTWPTGSALPNKVKNRTVKMYLCTDSYIKNYKKDTWRFYIMEVYYDKLENGKTDKYIWGAMPVYVNFKAHTIAFKQIDNTYKNYEPGLPKVIYREICNLLKSKNDMPNEE